MEQSAIRTFEQILVQIHEDLGSVNDVDEDMAIKFINKFWNVRSDPKVSRISTSVVYMAFVVNIGLKCNWVRETIDTFSTSIASAFFRIQMGVGMCHKLLYLAT